METGLVAPSAPHSLDTVFFVDGSSCSRSLSGVAKEALAADEDDAAVAAPALASRGTVLLLVEE